MQNTTWIRTRAKSAVSYLNSSTDSHKISSTNQMKMQQMTGKSVELFFQHILFLNLVLITNQSAFINHSELPQMLLIFSTSDSISHRNTFKKKS